MANPIQPTLPDEIALTDIEAFVNDLQPRGLWPTNQNSNFGLIRYLLSKDLEIASDLLTELANETFIPTSTGYLGRWEREFDLPPGQGGRTDIQRRTALLARKPKGPFTWARRAGLIEMFIAETFGESVAFTPEGIPLDSGGVALFADLGLSALSSVYRVYENVKTFSYEVWIISSVNPDIAALTRELGRITPAGISFTIDNSQAEINDYGRAVKNLDPIVFHRFNGNGNDESGYGNTANLFSSPTALASPGLLHANAAGGNAGFAFDGVSESIGVDTEPHIDNVTGAYTLSWLFRLPVLPGFKKEILVGDNHSVSVDQNGKFMYETTRSDSSVSSFATANGAIAVNTIYHLVITATHNRFDVWLNGWKIGGDDMTGDTVMLGIGVSGGQSTFFMGSDLLGGVIRMDADELFILDRVMTDAEIAEIYQQSIGNVL